MRFLISALLIFAFNYCFHASEIKRCPDEKMLGLRLGMTVVQAEKKTQRKLVLKDMYLSSSDFQSASFRTSQKTDVSLQFYKGKLFVVIVIYDNRINWQSVDAFTSWLSPKLRLKPVWTNIYQWDGTLEMSSLQCEKYNITATKSTPIGANRYFAVRLSEIKTDEASQKLAGEQNSRPEIGLTRKLKRYLGRLK